MTNACVITEGVVQRIFEDRGGRALFWLYLTIAIVVGLTLFSLALYWLIRWLGKREPYGIFLRLRTRQKLTFFRLLLRDRGRQIPLYVKLIPVVLVVYLSIPFDIIPDFVPVLGYLDDVALALLALVLIIKMTPRPVVLDLLRQARGAKPLPAEGEGLDR
jgi:uncharacterized membrane protein YkvA (DUF1232 family)